MVQLQILPGSRTGFSRLVKRFPCRIGRAPDADVRLEAEGVFDRHLELNLERPEGFVLTRAPQAMALVNGASFEKIQIRNGDLIEFGHCKIQFWLSATRQCNLRPRERMTWIAFGLLALLQVGLVFWLLQV